MLSELVKNVSNARKLLGTAPVVEVHGGSVELYLEGNSPNQSLRNAAKCEFKDAERFAKFATALEGNNRDCLEDVCANDF